MTSEDTESGWLVSLILTIAKYAVALLIAGVIIFLVLRFGGSATCNSISNLRHMWHNFCIYNLAGQAACASDFFPLYIPLFGCDPIRQGPINMNVEDAAQHIGVMAKDCWIKYGSGMLDVLWWDVFGENPATCSETVIDLSGKLYPFNITDVWVSTTHGYERDCTLCGDDPCATPGFECDVDNPMYCRRDYYNSYTCQIVKHHYVPCASGVYKELSYIQDGNEAFWHCVGNLSSWACDRYDYYYNSSHWVRRCVDIFEPENQDKWLLPNLTAVNNTPWTYDSDDPKADVNPVLDPGFRCGFCNDSGLIALPESCYEAELAKDECLMSQSYADLLHPGYMTMYSFKKSGETGNLTTEFSNDSYVEGRIHVFVEYMDSFTLTRKAVSAHELPPQCAVGYVMDSASPCVSTCQTAAVKAVGLYYMTRYMPLGPVNIGHSYKTPLGIGAGIKKIHQSIFIVGAAVECWNCFYNRFLSMPFVDLILYNDMLLVCIYEE
jgi:hypothetical protein